MSSSAYPDYIRGPVDWPVLPAPAIANGVTMWALGLKADQAHLQQVCDRYLNSLGAPGLHYRAITGYVLMAFLDQREGRSLVDPGYGSMPEKDLSFFIPVLVCKRLGRVWIPSHLAGFAPYLFVDNPVAVATGREMFGYLKQAGEFTSSQDARATFSVRTYAIKEFAPESRAGIYPLLDVSPDPGMAVHGQQGRRPAAALRELLLETFRPGAQTGISKLDAAIADLFKDQSRLSSLLDQGRGPNNVVFLKQFPDVNDASKACYQAIIESRLEPAGGVSIGFLEPRDYGVTLWPLATQPIASELGLAQPLSTDLGFWLRMDLKVSGGEEVYVKTSAKRVSGRRGP